MIIIDRALEQRERDGNPIRVGMIGAGYMGRAIARQIINVTPGMRLAAVACRTPAHALLAYDEPAPGAVTMAYDAAGVERAAARGIPCITRDPRAVTEADGIDVLVDVTGAVEYGAGAAVSAIAHGKHVILVSAELDATLGPLLKARGDAAGVVVSGCDGDQPGAEVNLWRFVRQLGLEPLVLGSVKGFHDVHRTPATQAEFARRHGQENATVATSACDGTKVAAEQVVVANATGMTVPCRGMLGWHHSGHVDDLALRYDINVVRTYGDGCGIVDYVIGAKPGPGVYCLAACDDPRDRQLLEYYKLGPGPLYSFYTPYHLVHFEVPASIARAVLFRDAATAPAGAPRAGVITLAKRDLPAGHVLDGMGGYDIYGQAERADVIREQRLLPAGAAEGCTLRRPVTMDEVLAYGDVDLPPGRLTDELLAEQEKMFPL
jgi:predicted homoserine dehydrogenase-like protein